jgi:hypothetical protein
MRFRWLQAGYVDGRRYEAGEIVEMPSTFVPPGACEPLDVEAVAAYFAAGPQPIGLIRQEKSDILLHRYPATYWVQSGDEWRLCGLGSSLGTKKATRPMELP